MSPTGFSLWPAIKQFQEEPQENISRWTGAFLGAQVEGKGKTAETFHGALWREVHEGYCRRVALAIVGRTL
jgi:hypothetical protein